MRPLYGLVNLDIFKKIHLNFAKLNLNYTMIKTFITIALATCTSVIYSQDNNYTERVILEKDSIPVFDKMYISDAFSSSYFYCTTNCSVAITASEFAAFNNDITNFNSDIKTFRSLDQKSIITIFPKHTIKGISDVTIFLENNFIKNNLTETHSSVVKHLQVVNQYDPLDTKRGFN